MNKAVFLDRDGTINEEVGYINHASRFKIFSYAFDAIRILNELGFKVIRFTNEEVIHDIEAVLLKIVTQYVPAESARPPDNAAL